MYHGTVFTNKEIRQLLSKHDIALEDFTLAIVKGKPAKTKGVVKIKGNKVTIFGSDFIAKGFINNR